MLKRLLAASLTSLSVMAGLAQADDAELHQPWDELLETYVVEAPDGINRFDYAALQSNTADTAKLDTYLASFETLDFDTLTGDEQFAAWSNIYNALTIKHIIERYPVKSIRSGYLIGPWKRVKTVVDGEEVSLDAIEHDILRVQFSDPRVHYAVNCASYGCPNLQTDAWVAATLDEDLDAAARDFVNHPRGVSIRDRGGLQVSTIYKWFREDFGDSEQGVIDHLLTYAEEGLAADIRANADIRKHAYDWALNDVDTAQR